MLTEHDLLLDLLMEECAEVIQRASKQLRFGRDEVQPGQQAANHERLRDEILDVLCAVRAIERAGQIEKIMQHQVTRHEKDRWPKVAAMLALSKAQGRMQP